MRNRSCGCRRSAGFPIQIRKRFTAFSNTRCAMAFSGVVPNDQRDVNIWIGVPPSGIHLCKLTTRGFNQSKEMVEEAFPDCDDPSITVLRSSVVSKAATIIVGGLLEPERRAALQNAYDNDNSQIYSFQIGALPPH